MDACASSYIMLGVILEKMKGTLIIRNINFGIVGNGKLGSVGVGLQFLKR
jgi:hypothetical protein